MVSEKKHRRPPPKKKRHPDDLDPNVNPEMYEGSENYEAHLAHSEEPALKSILYCKASDASNTKIMKFERFSEARRQLERKATNATTSNDQPTKETVAHSRKLTDSKPKQPEILAQTKTTPFKQEATNILSTTNKRQVLSDTTIKSGTTISHIKTQTNTSSKNNSASNIRQKVSATGSTPHMVRESRRPLKNNLVKTFLVMGCCVLFLSILLLWKVITLKNEDEEPEENNRSALPPQFDY